MGTPTGIALSQILAAYANNLLNDPSLLDPVSKLRVSEPQALIDTDFEYGIQPTKWETISVINNVPTSYIRPGNIGIVPVNSVTSTTGSPEITVTSPNHGLTPGAPIFITGLTNALYEGPQTVRRVLTNDIFTYQLFANAPTSESLLTPYTNMYQGGLYTGSKIPYTTIISDNRSNIIIQTASNVYLGTNTSMGLYGLTYRNTKFANLSTANVLSDPNVSLVTIPLSNSNVSDVTFDFSKSNSYLTPAIVPYNWITRSNIQYMVNSAISTTLSNLVTMSVPHNLNETNNYAVFIQIPPGATVPTTTTGAFSDPGRANVFYANTLGSTTQFTLRGTNTGANQRFSTAANLNMTAQGSNAVNQPYIVMSNLCEISNITNGLITTFTNLQSPVDNEQILFCSIGNNTSALSNLIIATTMITQPTYYYIRYPTAANSFYVSNAVNGNPLTNIGLGAGSNAFVAQLQNFPEQNSIYLQNHGMTQNTYVIYSRDGDVPGYTGSNIISNLVANSIYFANVINSNRIQILRDNAVVDLASFGTSNQKIQYLSSNISNLYSVVWPNHGLVQNEVLRYTANGSPSTGLSNTTVYYAKVLDSNTMRFGTNTFSDIRVTSVYKPVVSPFYAFNLGIQSREETNRIPFVPGDTIQILSPDVPRITGVYSNCFYSNGITGIANNFVTAVASNAFTMASNTALAINNGIIFSNLTGYGNTIINVNSIYYILSVDTSNNITVSRTIGGPQILSLTAASALREPVGLFITDTNSTNTLYARQVLPTNLGSNILSFVTESSILTNTFATRIAPITNNQNSNLHEVIQYQKINQIIKGNTFANTITFNYGSPLPQQTIRIDLNSIVNGTMTLIQHGLFDGAPLTYNCPTNSNIIGLLNSNTYYAVVLDRNNIQLTATYANAVNRTQTLVFSNLTLSGGYYTAANGLHFFTTNVLSSTTIGGGLLSSLSIANTTPLVNNVIIRGTNTRFYTGFSAGDQFIIEPSIKSNVSFIGGDNYLTLDTDIPAISNVGFLIPSFVVPNPDAYVYHRVYDGGVQMVGGMEPFESLIRQTHTQFRYQSGKGIQMSSGTIFNAPFDISSLIRSNNIVTVTTARAHGFMNNTFSTIKIANANVASGNNYYNGNNFTISNVVDTVTFTYKYASNLINGTVSGSTLTGNLQTNNYIASSIIKQNDNVINATSVTYITGINPTTNVITFNTPITNPPFETYPPMISTKATGYPRYIVNNTGNVFVRVGLFDQQNGMFFEYRQSNLYCVRRNSTTQLSGRVSVTKGSSIVIGTGTQFLGQVNEGDYIVIRGASYRANRVLSDTRLEISPMYKGITANNIIASETIDTRYIQSSWSIDKMDGTGLSKYNLDPQRIQMCYIDFAWYGAGKIRFGFKDTNGKVYYCHEILHNNREFEAYLRSGNLPARYEIGNDGPIFYNPVLNHWGTSVIMDGKFDDDKAYIFTGDSDILCFTNGNRGTFTTTFTRGSTQLSNISTISGNLLKPGSLLSQTARESNVSGTLQGSLITAFQPATKVLSVTIDPILPSNIIATINKPTLTTSNALYSSNTSGAQFLSNVAIVSLYPQLSVLSYAPIPLISIRLAPSVDSGTTALFGGRELVNRMQLVPKGLSVSVTHESTVTLYINADLSSLNWASVYSPSLSQITRHQVGDVVQNGVTLVTYRVSGGAIGTASSNTARNIETTRIDLSGIAVLSNAIYGGNETFPNGPDVLTVAITPIDTTNIQANAPYIASCTLSWTESQA